MGKLSHKVSVPRPHGGVELVSSLRLDLLVKVDLLHHGQVPAHQGRLSSWVAGDSFPSWWGHLRLWAPKGLGSVWALTEFSRP